MLEKALKFLKEVQVEMAKVTWPTRDELIGSTSVVLVVSLAFALFMFFCDLLLTSIMRYVLR